MFRKAFKILISILGLTALILAVLWLVLINKWPWWAGLSAGIGVVAVCCGIVFCKRFLLRRREKKFVQQIIAQDEAAIEMASQGNAASLRELQEKWKESIELLKKSQLKTQGNPLYVLPWYMLLGEPGSGKTTAIKSSNLSSPVSEVRKSAGIAGTRNFDWWFFNEAIILDTAGRYSIPVNEDMDREEWEDFLTLLAKYRKKEPLNGLIVTVSADSLLSLDEDALYLNGQSLRKRIDQLMRLCAAKFPVYLLVSKADLIHGLSSFSELLPEESLAQAMGYSVNQEKRDWDEALGEAFSTIVHRLKDLRILLVQQSEQPDPGVILFPDEFSRLKKGLFLFARGVFESNPYQKDPFFRGIYFASGRQEGEPCSEFLQKFPFKGVKNELRGKTANKIFLHDFFKYILPMDRNIYAPIAEYLKWHKTTFKLGIVTWMLIWCCLAGLVSYAAWKNFTVVQTYASEYAKPPHLGDNLSMNLLALNRYRLHLADLITKNRNWYVPRFGLRQSFSAERQMKDEYVQYVAKHIIQEMNEKLHQGMDALDAKTSDPAVAVFVNNIAARIQLIQDQVTGQGLPDPKAMAKMSSDMLAILDPQIIDEIAAPFGEMYWDYLKWNPKRDRLAQTLHDMQLALGRIVTTKGIGLRWLVHTRIPNVKPVGLSDFWGRQGAENMPSVRIAPALTGQGKTYLEGYLQALSHAIEEKKEFKEATQEFWSWYRRNYLHSWHELAARFAQGRESLVHYEQWKDMARKMTTLHNPYFDFITVMADNLEVYDHLPGWARSIVELSKARKLDYVGRTQKKKSLLQKLKSKGADVVQNTLADYGSQSDLTELKNRIALAKTWNAYGASLAKLAPVTRDKKQAYRMTRAFFPQKVQSNDDSSLFYQGDEQLFHVQSRMAEGFAGEADLVNGLIQGPFNFLVHFATREAACVLQRKWEEDVLAAVQGIPKEKVPYAVFKPRQGKIWDFLNGPAKPFIGRNENGFYPKSGLGERLPVRKSFLAFLTQGAAGTVDILPQYTVNIRALPIDANPGAKINPYGCVLTMQCADTKTRLENFNYPAEEIFTWSLDGCGDVLLQIYLPHVTLSKPYQGPLGFARFLNEFRDGTRIFTPQDFPGQSGYLKENGVQEIRVSYDISGAGPVVKLLHNVPRDVPQEIVSCW